MKILYLAQRVPYPPNRGDKIASYNAIVHLAKRHDVFVAALADSQAELAHAEELRKRGFRVDVALIPPWRARWSALKALGTGAPLSVAYFESKALRARIRQRVEEDGIEAVVTFSSSMGQYYDPAWKLPWIADFVDLDSRKWELYARWHTGPRAWVYRLEESRLLRYERDVAKRAACTLVRTESERSDCERLIPGARFEVLSNGVDLEYFDVRALEGAPPRRPPKDLVFTGVMDYFPNVQGVSWFAREVFPLVRMNHPEATFTIAGARPSKDVLALAGLPGVSVVGPQDDLRPFIAGARVAVVPLLLARGIQNKVLEAMAMSVPVVLTPAAFRGVDAEKDREVLVGDSPEEFADLVDGLLSDPERARAIGKRGRERVEARYVWPRQLERLEALLEEVRGSQRGCLTR